MNRVYRLVWSRTLRAPQVVSELTKASRGGVDASGDTTHARRRASIISIGVSLGLAGAALPSWAATCSSSTIAACSAAGGNGIPNRSGNGGSGNGGGGGSSTLGGGSATVQVPGGPTSGGTGGTGATNDSGQGGPGGAPAVVLAGDAVVNANAQGGSGQAFDGFTFAGGAGGGGAGVYSTGTSVTVNGGMTVQGGAGGNGGAGTSGPASNGGGGGGGGAAFVIVTPAADVNNQGTLIGGNGGNGGSAGNPGGGGGGGDGLLTLGSGTQVTNIGSIVGGVGGASGGGGSTAGASGAGVNLAAGFNVLSNVGTITGGAGNGGAAGVGVITNGDVIVNGGTISGGLYSDGVTRAAAIQFNGTNNTLQLLTGSNIIGNLDVAAGAAAKITAGSAGLSLSNNVTLGDATSRVTLDSTTTNLVVSGVISGAGSVGVTGSRTITLTGDNTYTGATTITTGTLQIGNGATTGSVAGNIVNNGTLAFNRSDAVTYAGTISGAGNLVQAGAGMLTISGTAGYAGSTTINAGTLALSGAGSIAASSGVVNNGTFDISGTTSGATINALTGTGAVALGSRTLTLANAGGAFSGAIGGTGGLTLNGGTQTLSGVNTYSGATTINAGTLALSGAGRLASATRVTLTGASSTLDLSASGNQTVAYLSGVAGSRVVLNGSALTLADDSSQTFSGSLSGNGALIKQGTGTLTLNGVSSGFSGSTTVAGGTLAVGDAANAGAVLGGNVLVNALGTLRGHGTVSGDVSSSGVVAPGGSIGTLSVGGNYTQGSTGMLAIEVSPTDAAQLRVGGAAALGGSLAIVFDPGTYTARRYTVLSAVSGVTGRFANVNTATAGANLGTLQTSVDYGRNAVDVLLAEATAPGNPGSPTVVAPTKTTIYTAQGTTALLQAQGANAALLGRVSGPQDALAGSKDVWVTASGSSTKVGGSGNAPGFLTHAYGFLAGAEGRVGAATVGVAGGYTHTTLGEDTTGASGTIDTLRVALYGAQPMGAVDLSATVGYGLDFLSQKRPFGSVGTAEGDHLAHEFTAATQASLPLEMGGIRLAPHVGMRYAYVRGSGFGENGANGQNLQVGPDSARSLQPYVGVTLDKAFGDVRPLNVQLRVGYAHELMNAGRVVQVQSQDGTAFTAPGTDLPRSFLTTGASVTLQATKATTVSLGVDATLNTSHVSTQSAYVRVNHRF